MEIISRSDAIKAGLNRYFTGKPCPRGHVSGRYVSIGACAECSAERAQDRYAAKRKIRESVPRSPRQIARDRGDKQYTPINACHRCNTSKRLTSNGSCLQCSANKMRELYREDAEFRDNRAAYRKRESEAVKAHVRKRRAAQHNAEGSHNAEDIADLFDDQEGRCPYCNVFLRNWHVDHKTPLTRGGANSKDNLQLTCAACNTRKHTKTDAEFRAVLARALAVSES